MLAYTPAYGQPARDAAYPSAIIAALDVTDGLPQQLSHSAGEVLRPVLHHRGAVVSLRQSGGQPSHGQLVLEQPLLQARRSHTLVQHLS